MRCFRLINSLVFLTISLCAAPVWGQGGYADWPRNPSAGVYPPAGRPVPGGFEASRVISNLQSPSSHPSLSGHAGVCSTCPAPACCPEVCVPCCVCACDDSGRQWALEVGALGLFRADPSSATLLQNPLVPTEFVDAGQFDFSAAAGLEAALTIYHEFPQLTFEFRAQLPDEWQATVRQSFTGNTVNVGGSPPLVTTGPRNSTSRYQSQYRSFLADARWRPGILPETSWTLGLRSVTLDESLVSTLVDPGAVFPDEVVRSATSNQLTGIHVGVDWNVISTCDLCVKLNGRAGLFANQASQNSQLESLANPPVVFPASGSGTDAAGIFEVGIEGRWKLSECLNATMGYRLMALSGVALASDQLQAVDFINQRGLDTNSTLVLQSLRVGLELHY